MRPMQANKWLRRLQRGPHTSAEKSHEDQPREPVPPTRPPTSTVPSLLRSPVRTLRTRSTSRVASHTSDAAAAAAAATNASRQPDDFNPAPSATSREHYLTPQSSSSHSPLPSGPGSSQDMSPLVVPNGRVSAPHPTPSTPHGTPPPAHPAPSAPNPSSAAYLTPRRSLSSGAEEWRSTEDLRVGHALDTSQETKGSQDGNHPSDVRSSQNLQVTEGVESERSQGPASRTILAGAQTEPNRPPTIEGAGKAPGLPQDNISRSRNQWIAPHTAKTSAPSTRTTTASAAAAFACYFTTPDTKDATGTTKMTPAVASTPSSEAVSSFLQPSSRAPNSLDHTTSAPHATGSRTSQPSLPSPSIAMSDPSSPLLGPATALRKSDHSEDGAQRDLASSLAIPTTALSKTSAQQSAKVTPKAKTPMASWLSPSLINSPRQEAGSEKPPSRTDVVVSGQVRPPPTKVLRPVGQDGPPQLGEVAPLAGLSQPATDDDLLASWGLGRLSEE